MAASFASTNDDAGHPDSRVTFRAPADAIYEVVIWDHLRRGGESFAYRIEVTHTGSRATARVLPAGRYEDHAVAVPRGGRSATRLALGGLPNGTKIEFAALPKGLVAHVGSRLPGSNVVPVVFESSADSKVAGYRLGVRARVPRRKEPIDVLFQQGVTLVRVRNQQPYFQIAEDRLPLAVTEAAPFRIEVVPPKVPILRGGPLALKVRVHRAKNFKGAVRARLLFNPPGISASQVTIRGKEAVLKLNANGGAGLQTWKLAVVGRMYGNRSFLETSSKLFDLSVSQAWISATLGKARAEQGKACKLSVKLNTKHSFAGKCQAKLYGLPGGVKTSFPSFDARAKTIEFPLEIAKKARAGRHRNLLLRFEIPTPDGTVVQHLRGGRAQDRSSRSRQAQEACGQARSGGTAKERSPPQHEGGWSAMRLTFFAFALCASTAYATPSDDDRAVELRILPTELELSDARDLQRVTVLVRFADGRTRDVTKIARLRVASPIASLRGGKLHPEKNGTSELLADFAGLDAKTKLVVRGIETRPPISFANEVIPTLTRAGCNAGSCHGAASGKNGFRLTLFGYDKRKDFVSLTRELRARRVDVAEPAASLMLTKPTTEVGHKGGRRLRRGDGHYERLLSWVDQGASSDLAKAPRLRSLAVFPEQAVLEGAGQRQQLVVLARYSDGSDRDVTEMALIGSSDEGSVKVEGDGLLTSGTPGEASVLVRFQTLAVVSQVLVLDAKKRGFAWPKEVKARNYVDEAIHDKLRKLRIAPAGVCDDATFVRRLYLDLLNVLPEARDVRGVLDRQAFR